jgi:hypothetical protein
MSTKKAEQKAVAETGKAAINCFPKADIFNALQALADSKATEGDASKAAGSASLHVTELAAEYGKAAHEIANGDTSTVLGDWKANSRLLALELAAAGSPFAETSTNAAGDTVGKLTGTGNNVMSIAKGVVDFRLNIADCVNEDGEVSYRSVRQTVEAARAERRAQENPEMAALADAKEAARESWKALSKVVFDTGDIQLIADLSAMLDETAEAATADIAAQAALDFDNADDEQDHDVEQAV